MMADRTSRLIEELAANLAPVTPLPRLRAAIAGLLAVGTVVVVGVVVGSGGMTAARLDRAGDSSWLGIAVGLVLLALGGCAGGLASGIPGRNSVAKGGAAVAALGFVTALVSALVGVGAGESWSAAVSSGAGHCFVSGVTFAIVPVLVGVAIARRAWPLEPRLTAVLVLLGTMALGALAVHLTCPLTNALHMLLGHNATPLVATAIAAPVATLWLRRAR